MVEVIWEETGVLRRLTGVVTLQELDASGAQLQGHERTDSLRYIIHDFSGCEEVDADRRGIEYLVARASVAIRAIPNLKVAFVGKHPVIQTILDIHEDLGVSPHEWRRFENLEDARRFVSGRQSAGA